MREEEEEMLVNEVMKKRAVLFDQYVDGIKAEIQGRTMAKVMHLCDVPNASART